MPVDDSCLRLTIGNFWCVVVLQVQVVEPDSAVPMDETSKVDYATGKIGSRASNQSVFEEMKK